MSIDENQNKRLILEPIKFSYFYGVVKEDGQIEFSSFEENLEKFPENFVFVRYEKQIPIFIRKKI